MVCALGLLAGCGLLQPPADPPASSTPPSQTSTSTPTPTPTPKPSPTPTSREDKAVADSKQALQAFHKALNRMANEGGGDGIPEYLDPYLTDGPAREFHDQDARFAKKYKIRAHGAHTLRNLRVLNLDLKQSMIIWQ